MRKKIIIIGGAGFIGQGMRKLFQQLNYECIIIGRHLNAELYENEVFYSVKEYSFRELTQLLAGQAIESLIDLAYASVPNTSYADPVTDFSENLANVIHHLDFALAIKASKFVYVSSGGTVYGDTGLPEPLKETDANFPLSPYGITKMACERYVHMYYKLYGLSTLIIRPSNIYGPGQKPFRGQGLVATALGSAFKKEAVHIFGEGINIRDYLFIDDFCKGMMALISKGKAGEIYNLGYGKGNSILQIIDCIDRVLENDDMSLIRQPHPERPFDVHYNVLSVEKIRNVTGWKPETSLYTGIYQTWTWIKDYIKNDL